MKWSKKSLPERKREAFLRVEDQEIENINERLVANFLAVIDLAKKKKKFVIGVRFPVTREYLDCLNEKETSRIDFIIRKQLKEDILDYSISDIVENDSYFIDMDHLNVAGAQTWTKRFVDDLECRIQKSEKRK
jgi:hypothetical protein